ncbi:sensor histidine kinase KdpD [Candidatus Cyanaurora vandensis]|uniref:sensor histidine kinase n=1 Tax=Candidatus Cyanaurora vandensis TaxID=2714958 RepID=UPI00257EA5D0|nr:ATP-binding protein [Candidatus Cyanaurora vandensis]
MFTNAYKYTAPQNRWSLRLTNDDTTLTFTVGNQAHIPGPELGLIFNQFYRIPASDQWQQGGTGLGLTLVQRLVQQLGGTLTVHSDKNWTAFNVTLSTRANLCGL